MATQQQHSLAAAQGDAVVQFSLSTMLLNGQGEPKDEAEARHAYASGTNHSELGDDDTWLEQVRKEGRKQFVTSNCLLACLLTCLLTDLPT